MSLHTARLVWARSTPDFDPKTYVRDHTLSFASGVTITNSAAAGPSTPPGTVGPGATDPEALVVSAVSACHMLFFIAFAAKRGVVVDRYEDDAVGLLEPKDGATWLTRITLKPKVTWGGTPPAQEVIDALHHDAHKRCYIANSLKGEVVVEPA